MDLSAELSRSLALRVGLATDQHGAPSPENRQAYIDALEGAWIPEGSPYFAVLCTPSLTPIVELGTRPGPLEDGGLDSWLLEAIDLRAAVAGRRTERGEWQRGSNFLLSSSYAVASTPVVARGRVVGAIRVVMPIGSPVLGPPDRRLITVLLASVLLSAIILGAFGYFLLQRRILAPLSVLVGGTKQLTQGRFDARIPAGPANELGELGRVFNEMAGALESYKAANEAQMDELRMINADLTQAREDLLFAEKMATVGRLAAGVAHEVGNPLASVIGFIELLAQSERDTTLDSDLLQRIRSELERIHVIIRDLLNYSHPTGTTETEEGFATAVSVVEVARNAMQLVEVQPRFTGVRIHLELDEALPEVQCPPGRLQQVFLNLFVNASEAMGGKGTIRVKVLSEETKGFLALLIEDDGPGVDPRDRSNIFVPFFTTKDVGEGTGLGLSVSLRLVERMGGDLRLRRQNRPGASFTLHLPLSPGAEGALDG